MRNTVNWLLIGSGGILIAVEVLLGAATGFDLARMGVSLAAGGGVGLFFHSTKVGLFSSGALAFLYLGVLRNRIRSHKERAEIMRRLDVLNNTLGQNTKYIVPSNAGLVNVLGLDAAAPLIKPHAGGAPGDAGSSPAGEPAPGMGGRR